MAKKDFTSVDKTFMVYLIQSSHSYPKYNAWLCGGALVRYNKVLTSAACLVETTKIYVIAGYNNYVKTSELDKDNCTSVMKRRVIQICVPQAYVFNVSSPEAWMTLDIGVAMVDRPYSATEMLFKIVCDYVPKPISILYHKDLTYDYQDVVAYGWGFMRGRRPGDTSDYNSKKLKFASLRLENKETCKASYEGLNDTIDKYLLCTKYAGVVDDGGRIKLFSNSKYNDECQSRRHDGFNGKCDHETNRNADTIQTDFRKQIVFYEIGKNDTLGICQNDHGGPLVTHIGATEMVIGVAVNTIYDKSYQCIGPSVYTSTACTGQIIMCMLSNNPKTRRNYEQVIKEQGFKIYVKDIVWEDDPADHTTPGTNIDSKSEETTPHLNVTTEEIANKSTDVPI